MSTALLCWGGGGAAQTPAAAVRPDLEPALSRAELAMSLRNYEEALAALSSIGETPDLFVNYYLGICLAETQRPREAASRLEKVLSSVGVPSDIAEDGERHRRRGQA